MGLVAAADMEVGLIAAKTELEVWLVWKEAGKDVGWVSVVLETVIGELKKAFGTGVTGHGLPQERSSGGGLRP